ncbi:hypothetical protein [Clostridium gasigenes]|uniref:ABC-2 family transporter protein n=1 Tax=Clostridium gasigenes TaxID=94869 RepID=A0A7X0SJM0_9CLOT|nr:hypothetical protein [Clostridium gasigenes]MBB6716666.1 hypothetical protein [Clostridium gasigenes]
MKNNKNLLEKGQANKLEDLHDIPDIDIASIVDLGVKVKKSFFTYLKDMIQEIGLKSIFHDKNEVIFISLLVVAVLGFFMINISDNSSEISEIYRFIFVSSPILYIVILLFSLFNTKEKGTYELEMSCKYNLYQMLALRMFIFSLISTVVNTIIILLVFMWKHNIDVLRAVCVSVTGLFLFSSVFIYIALSSKREVSKLLLVGSWVAINIGIYFIDKKMYDTFLMEVPIYIHLIVTLVCVIFYVKNLNRFINFRSERGGF